MRQEGGPEVEHVVSAEAEAAAPMVSELLRRCGRTQDRAERAALLTRVGLELDKAAHVSETGDSESRERAAHLRGQASMARFVASLERSDRARRVAMTG